MTAAASAGRWLDPWGYGAVLALVAFGAYAPALGHGFVWDDVAVLVESTRLHQWSALLEVFRQPAMWASDLPLGPIGTYRPLALATFVVDHKLWSGAAWGFHLTSIAIHAAVVVVMFALGRRLLGRPGAAFALALLVAVHPAAVEAIAWVNGRSEPLALLFGGLALLLASAPAPLRPHQVALLGLCLLAALLGKETAAIFTVLAPLLAGMRPPPAEKSTLDGTTGPGMRPPPAEKSTLDGTVGPRPHFGRPPLAVLLAAAAALALYALLRTQALGPAAVPSKVDWSRVVVALPALWMRAAQMALLPLERAPLTVGRWLAGLSSAEVALYVAATLAVAGGLVFLLVRGRHLAVFGFGWWLASMLPAGLVVSSAWPGLARWLYIGLPGLVLGAWTAGLDRWARRPQVALAAAAGLMFLALTERAIPIWKDNHLLYAAVIEESPRDPFGYQGLGVTRLRARDCPSALTLFEKAVALGSRNQAMLEAITYCRTKVRSPRR